MRTFNFRFAVTLLVTVAVFGVGVYLLNGYQIRRNARTILDQAKLAEERAEKAAKAKDPKAEFEAYQDAIKYFQWYVRLTPADFEAQERFGLLLANLARSGQLGADEASLGMLKQASGLLEKVTLQNPDRDEARRQLAEIAVLSRRYSDAKDHLQRLLEKSPEDPELLELLGRCQVELGADAAALDSFTKVVNAKKGKIPVTAYSHLATLLRNKLSKPKEADEWMAKSVRDNPKSAKARLFYSRYLSGTGRTKEALDEAMRAVELDPDDGDILCLAAGCQAFQRQYAKARDYMARGIRLHPERLDMYVLLSRFEKEAGNRDEAVAALEKGLKLAGRNPQLLWEMANLWLDFDKPAEAQKIIDELRKADFPKQGLTFLEARVDFTNERWLAARQGLERARDTTLPFLARLTPQMDWLIGRCYGELGNREREIQGYRRALNVNAAFLPARLSLVNALMAAGKVDEAWEECHQLAVRGRIPGIVLLAAKILLIKTLQTEPAQRDWQTMEKVLQEAQKAGSNPAEIFSLQFQILMAKGDVAAADKLAREANEKDPKQVEYWRALFALAGHRKDWDQMEKLIQGAEKSLGDCVDVRLAWAAYDVQRYGTGAKERLRKLAENTDRFSDAECVRLWGDLVNFSARADDVQQVDVLAKKVAKRQPNNARVYYLQLERAIANGDQVAMKDSLREIERLSGQGAYWLYGQAVLLHMQSKDAKDSALLEQALGYLTRARELRGDWPRIPMAMGTIYDALGRSDAAMKSYIEALEMGDRSPFAVQRAVQLLFHARQFVEAYRWLRQIEKESGKLNPELGRAVVEAALAAEDYDRALDSARKAVAADTKDYKELLWRGRVLGFLGNQAKNAGDKAKGESLLDDAEKSFRRATELEPKKPRAWAEMTKFFAATGQKDKAEKATREAEQQIAAEDAPLALAQCYEVLDKNDAAEKQYKTAMAAAPKDVAIAQTAIKFYLRTDKTPQAEALIQKVMDGKVDATSSDIAMVRRQLALIYLKRGSYKEIQKGRKLIEQNLAGPDALTLDKQLLIRIDAVDPRSSQREKAVGALSELDDATPEDRLMEAKMADARGDWIKASGIYRGLVANNKDPNYLIVYIGALLRHGEFSNAEMYLDRLEKVVPNWFDTVALRAELLYANKRPDKAIQLLKDFVANSEMQPKDANLRTRLAAEKLELLSRQTKPAQPAAAEQCVREAGMLYRLYAQKVPDEGRLVLAMFLARRGQADEALGLLEQAMGNIPPNELAQVCSILAQEKNLDDVRKRRLMQIIKKAVEKSQHHVAMLAAAAELAAQLKEYADAEAWYREILQKNSGNPIVMNNLAVLLAMQGIKLDEAHKLINQAIEIAGPVGAILDSRATIYIAMNKPAEALKDIAESLADAETPVRLFHQAQAFQVAGQTDRARAAFKKALQKKLTREMLHPLEHPAFDKFQQTEK